MNPGGASSYPFRAHRTLADVFAAEEGGGAVTDKQTCQCWRHPGGTVRRASCPVHGGPPLDRIFAAFRPADDNIALFFDRGMIDLSIAEARILVGTLTEALAIGDGLHPAQAEASTNHQEMERENGI